MKVIGIYEAKTHFSEIMNEVAKGEHFIVTKHGNKIAEIRACKSVSKRKRGSMKKFFAKISDDFNEPLTEFSDYQ